MPEIEIHPAPGPRPAIVRLRVATEAAAKAADALSLPVQACTAALGDPDRLWLGPDQWLLVSRTRTADQLIDACTERLDAIRHHAVDSSAALERHVVSGRRARALLAMGCAIDFDAAGFAVGRCVRTRFARIAVVILAREPDEFELLYDRSYREYLWQWLTRAAGDPLLAD